VTTFLDSSALVKRYADEPGADEIRALGGGVNCAIARVEVPAAIWRKHRLGELDVRDAAALVAEFEWEWAGDGETESLFVAADVTDEVLEAAASACSRHGLRAYDAVQLAAALAARDAEPAISAFACFDAELVEAARREGFTVIP
jgi:predicted nucleic acid-binding protein